MQGIDDYYMMEMQNLEDYSKEEEWKLKKAELAQ